MGRHGVGRMLAQAKQVRGGSISWVATRKWRGCPQIGEAY